MTQEYRVAYQLSQAEYEIKKSRFIGLAISAVSREEALEQLRKIKEEFPDARHHCWAYVIGNPHSPSMVAMSDDGEPSGTAGKPILNVLQHKAIGDIILIVVRYFGGIKLGAGGLVRAYSTAAQMTLSQLDPVLKVPTVQLRIRGEFALEQSLRHWLNQNGGEVMDIEYGSGFVASVSIREKLRDSLQLFLGVNNGAIVNHDIDA